MANDPTQQEAARSLVPPLSAHGQGQTNGHGMTVRRVPAPQTPSAPPQTPPAQPAPPARPPKKSGFGFLVWLLILLALLGGAGWAVYHFYFQPAPQNATAGGAATAGAGGAGKHRGGFGDVIRVVPATATKGDIDVYLTGIGSVTPYNTVTLQARVSGQLMKVEYADGQAVKTGKELVAIDDRPYQAQLKQLQAQKEHDQALLDNAKIDLDRYETLLKLNSIQSQTRDTQASLVKQDQGTVDSDEAQIEATQLNIDYCHIASPIDGVAGLKLVDVGNQVFANNTNLVIVNQVQPIYVDFTINEKDVPPLMEKIKAGVALAVDAYDGSNTTKLASGTLLTPDNQIDTSTLSLKLRALFTNENGALYPNQAVYGHLLLETKKDVVLIPTAAIQYGTQGTFVYTINGDDPKNATVKMTPVKVGTVESGQAEITSGLNEGDEMVIDGVDKLADGSKVIVSRNGGENAGSSNAPAPSAPAN